MSIMNNFILHLTLLLLAHQTHAKFFRPPKVPDNNPQVPDIPSVPYRPPGSPDVPNPGTWVEQPPQVPSQEQVQMNMGRLEQKLEAANLGMDVVENVVDAILDSPAKSTGPLGGVEEITSTNSDVTFTPSTTLPSSSFWACTAYASRVRSCAGATTSFYSLPASSQASCACYSTSSITNPAQYQVTSCGSASPSSTQRVDVRTLATDNFDPYARWCQEFLSTQGYENGAKALSGKSSANQTILGVDFCSNVDRELKSGNGTGLKQTGEPVPWGQCQRVYNLSQPTTGDAGRATMVTFLDQSIFVTTSAVVAMILWVVCS